PSLLAIRTRLAHAGDAFLFLRNTRLLHRDALSKTATPRKLDRVAAPLHRGSPGPDCGGEAQLLEPLEPRELLIPPQDTIRLDEYNRLAGRPPRGLRKRYAHIPRPLSGERAAGKGA